eukprot:11156763-Lingulodinium_polyedra.AAC.1
MRGCARQAVCAAGGVVYDALIRERWSDKLAAGVADFDVGTVAACVEYDAVRMAAAQRVGVRR